MLRNLFNLSGLTLVSRVLGLIRDMMVLHFLGTGPASALFADHDAVLPPLLDIDAQS